MARRPSSGFDFDNEEADVRANVAVADGHVDIRSSAVKLDDNHDDADDCHFYDTLTLISLLALSTPTSTPLAFHFSLHSPPCPLSSPLLLVLLLLGSPSEIQESSLS